jgi:hypothetical protein
LGVVTLTADEQRALSELGAPLEAHDGPVARLLVTDPDGRQVGVPVADPAALAATARLFRPGKPVTILDEDTELTAVAAHLLRVPPQYLARLLERGAIPYHLVGTHHHLWVGDLLAYRARRRAGVRDLARPRDAFGIDDE